MILEEIKNIKSEAKDLRAFGLTVGIILGLVGGLLWWHDRTAYPYFLAASLLLLLLGLIQPGLLKPLQKIWMSLAVVLGWLSTRIVLTITFYVILTPIGILARILGQNSLNLKISEDSASYWISKEQRAFHRPDYERQF